jgi:hypothetical protein
MLEYNTYLVWSGVFAETNVSMDAEDLTGLQVNAFASFHLIGSSPLSEV